MIKKLLFLLTIATPLFSCSKDNETDTGINADNINANIGEYASRLEIPSLRGNGNDVFMSHYTIENKKEVTTYSIAYDTVRRHARWTAFTFDASNRAIKWKRDNWENTEWGGDPFQPNPELPSHLSNNKDYYNKNGFVRGHIVASYDRVYSKDANEQTFYYTNISPMHSRFNTGLWNDLEMKVQNWGRNNAFCDTLYIVKGGTIAEGQYTSKGTCTTVPKFYYMALMRKKNDTYSAIGFWLEHKTWLPGVVADYAVSIDKLEELTGIDFFCNLPDKLENVLESEYYKSHWTGL